MPEMGSTRLLPDSPQVSVTVVLDGSFGGDCVEEVARVFTEAAWLIGAAPSAQAVQWGAVARTKPHPRSQAPIL